MPFTRDDLQRIEQLVDDIEYETVDAGDAGDTHKLKVGRFRRDIEVPIDLNPLSANLMAMINSDLLKTFYRQLTHFDNVCIRRAQANHLEKNDFVGLHIDGEGDPQYKGTHKDYKYAVVLHFGLGYEGGDTILYSPQGTRRMRLPEYSMLIITGALPHEVEKVESGVRKTLVYFLSDNFGASKI